MTGPLLRAGEAARQAGVNVETLRYYERRRLLPAPDRSNGGHRLYPPAVVTTLRVIKAAQRLGFRLDEVADLIRTGRHHHGRATAGLQAAAAAKLAEVEQRLADLTVIRDSLLAALDAGCRDLEECARAEGCPIPFAELDRRAARRTGSSESSVG